MMNTKNFKASDRTNFSIRFSYLMQTDISLARTKHAPVFSALLLAFTFFVIGLDAQGATYYVDPASGDDSNSGTSKDDPWKTIPGTRTTENSGFINSKWGDVSIIESGDTIIIKAGTTMTSALGGRLVIDRYHYDNGTGEQPIVIRVSDDWGSGNFIYDLTGITIPIYESGVHINQRDHIHLSGSGENRRFVIINASGGGWGIMSEGSPSLGKKQTGIVLDYLELANNGYGGSSISYSDDWEISNSISHDNDKIGFDTGGVNDSNANNGKYSYCTAYNNGNTDNTGGIAHGFGLYGSTNITFYRCEAHDNVRDGFDFGTTSDTHDASAVVTESASYNNGEDGFGANGGYSGTRTFEYVNVLAFNNSGSGWDIYDGVTVKISNSIIHDNGVKTSFGGNIISYTEAGMLPTYIELRNNIFSKPKNHAQIYFYKSTGGDPIVDSDYNLYIARNSENEVAFEVPYGTELDYQSPPSFIGSHDIFVKSLEIVDALTE